MKKPAIVITNSIAEVIEFHELVGDMKFREKAHNPPKFSVEFSYKTEWYWVFDGKDISGSSGTGSLKNTMNNYPNLGVFTIEGYRNLIK